MQYRVSELVAGVIDIIRESLELEDQEVGLQTCLVNDLGAESLDFLDIIFRMERTYKIKVERGRMERELRERFPDQAIMKNSPIGPELAGALKEMMPEIPPEKIERTEKLKDLAAVFTVATFVRLGLEGLRARDSEAVVTWDIDNPFSPQQLGAA